MNRATIDLGIVVATALLASCASSPRHTAPAHGGSTSNSTPYDFREEGNVPAPDPSDAAVEPDVEEIPVAESSLEVADAEAPPPETLAVPVAADSTAEGFRVQVFASSDRDVANNAAAVAEERLGANAYVVLDGGMYKVRVGDYRVRTDAEAALATIRKHYYPDAWIVPGAIRVPRKP
jgi:cell division septation protein DedD